MQPSAFYEFIVFVVAEWWTNGDISQRTHICESPTPFCLSEPSKWLRFSLHCSALLISQQNFILFAVVCTGKKYNFERNGMYIVIIGYDKELNELNSHSTKANGTKTEHRMDGEKNHKLQTTNYLRNSIKSNSFCFNMIHVGTHPLFTCWSLPEHIVCLSLCVLSFQKLNRKWQEIYG